MNTEPTTTSLPPGQPAQPAWGDSRPPAPKWSGKKTAIAAAVAVAIVAAGGVAIYAAGSSGSGQQSGTGGPGRMGTFAGGPGGGDSIMRNALHGDFTVSENGSYVTERLQTGTVSALSATSITVKSTDDYTQTYAIDSSTERASDLATGSSATVTAKVSGTSATALRITDPTQAQQGGGPGGMQGGPGGQAQGQPGSAG
jgi:hypothetical protein